MFGCGFRACQQIATTASKYLLQESLMSGDVPRIGNSTLAICCAIVYSFRDVAHYPVQTFDQILAGDSTARQDLPVV